MTSRLEGVRAIQLRQQGRLECFDEGDSLILIYSNGNLTQIIRNRIEGATTVLESLFKVLHTFMRPPGIEPGPHPWKG